MNFSTIRKLLSKNWFIYSVLIGLTCVAYGNKLGNEFTVVDDMQTFVNNDTIRSFAASLQTFQLQIVLYSIFYHLFGVNPLPLHIMAIVLHAVNAILFFTLFRWIFDRSSAIAAAVLFAVHPVNTEAVTWISGIPYLFNALVTNISVLFYLLYKRTKQRNHLITSVAVFIVGMITIQTIWLVTIPLIIFIIEQFIVEKRFNLKLSKALIIFIIPLVVFGTVYVGIKGTERLSRRAVERPMNQQTLKPIIESAPYTVFTMTRQYLYPKDLMIYYDGNPITPTYYASMYIASFFYLLTILYLWNKKRHIAAILVIMPLLLAPTYSPIKVAWYLSERYLYYGTGYFTMLLALFLFYAGRRLKQPVFPIALIIIIAILYTSRTIARNSEYKNSETLARATIRTSPMSIRGYDDLGGDFLMKGKYKEALPLYKKSLTLLTDANTPISNLGYIYIIYGIPQTENDLTETRSTAELLRLGRAYYEQARYTNAFYYTYQSSLTDPSQLEPRLLMGDIYIKTEYYDSAEALFLSIAEEYPDDYMAYDRLAYLAFQMKDYERAEQYLNEVLARDPENKNALDNMTVVEKMKTIDIPATDEIAL